MRTVKSIHSFCENNLKAWFPDLPKYEGYLARLNAMDKIFIDLSKFILSNKKFHNKDLNKENLMVVDSMPILLAKGNRGYKCQTAKEFSHVGYCSSKKLYYYGVKFHLLADYQEGTLPSPKFLKMTSANIHDLTAMKEHFFEINECKILGDKAYSDKKTKDKLKEKKVELHTPIKLKKGKKSLEENEKIYSKIVSSFRQSIEIFFSWIIEVTGIQNGSKIRSNRGLFVHVFGRFSTGLFAYLFR